MARRTNLISAILGGVGGGIEAGLEQRERTLSAREREAERKRAAEAAQLQREQFDALQAQRGREAEAAAAERALRFANEGITAIDPLANASRRAMDAAPAPTMPRPAGMSMTQGRAPQGVAPLFTLGGKEYAKTGPSAVERALQTTRAEEERKIQTLMATGMTRQDAAAQVIAGRAPTAKILPPWQREGFGSEAEYLDFLGAKEARTRAPRTPGATPDQELAEKIDAAVLQYSRQQVPGLPGMPAQFPTEQQVRQYRELLRRTMGLEAATPAASGGAATESPDAGPPPTLAPSVNPMTAKAALTADEAERLGVDFQQYQQNPAYRAFVDRQR